jgi:ketosteroid isomerase-like protein
MSQVNVEIVGRLVEIFNESGFAAKAAVEFLDPSLTFEEPPEQPAPRVGRGLEASTEMFNQFDENWEEHRSTAEEIRMIDGDRVLMLSIEHFRGRDGIEIDQPCGSIFTLRDGKVIRLQSFWERASALAAAGLSE